MSDRITDFDRSYILYRLRTIDGIEFAHGDPHDPEGYIMTTRGKRGVREPINKDGEVDESVKIDVDKAILNALLVHRENIEKLIDEYGERLDYDEEVDKDNNDDEEEYEEALHTLDVIDDFEKGEG